MANAKKCDVCGGFYQVPEFGGDCFIDRHLQQLNYIIIHKADEKEASLYFDCCEQCQQEVLDYIMSRHVPDPEDAI
jgi:hypothetical protein